MAGPLARVSKGGTRTGLPAADSSGMKLSHAPCAPAVETILASMQSVYYVSRIDMETVTLSPKYQVVIPQAVREALKLKPGEKFHVLQFGDQVELIPARRARDLRGLLRGMDPAIEREGDRL